MTLTTAPPGLYEDLPEIDGEAARKLSFLRVLMAVILLGGAGYGAYLLVKSRINSLGTVPGTWFAPYVDVTLTPTYQFQLPSANPARQSVLGFVVQKNGSACTPSWGGVYTLDQANQLLNFDSRLVQIKAEGGTPIVSFGGQKNTSLQVGCTDQAALNAAVAGVVDRYGLKTIDFDVEGSALNNLAADRRLAKAVAAVQSTVANRNLGIWLTVPVETDGLQDNAQALVSMMLRNRVSLSGVNVMAMDFNLTQQNVDMLSAVESALTSSHQQLGALFGRYGIHLRSKELWNHIGATVMIGQNNQVNQIFTISDASGLSNFAKRTGLARVSLWSLNRDSQCGAAYGQTGVLSNTCSGVSQQDLGFSRAFGRLSGTVAVKAVAHHSLLQAVSPDLNPADSPYPQWNGAEPYTAGYKVVRQGYIYEAKWYNQGYDPAAKLQLASEVPWLMIGPVLPGSHQPKLPTLPEGTYPDWSVTQTYKAGDKVLFSGLPYQAKYSTQGASPAAEATDPPASPWSPLFTIPGEPKGSD